MECNKEEAIRAKEIAEKKMQSKDFVGAKKIALKAQKLYPDLENISQMIMVCDVHCSAENKVFGNEVDWYGILKIEPTADEASIRKQYRKFALLLHPDKNKFAGAADAFKLIGEAQRLLLDRDKRILHESKHKASRSAAPNWGPQQASNNPNVGKQPWAQNHYMSKATSQFRGFNPLHQRAQRQTQPTFSNNQQTFWTLCPLCLMRFQFYRICVNKLLSCPKCKKVFTGYEIEAHSTPSAFPQPKEGPNLDACKTKVGSQVNVVSENQTREPVPKAETSKVNHKQGSTSQFGGNSKNNKRSRVVATKIDKEGVVEDSKSSGRVNGKKRKEVTESSESCDSGSVEEDEDSEVLDQQNFGCYGEYPRRSTRSKQHVSYDENLSDDENLRNNGDHGRLLKRDKCSGSVGATEQEAEDPDSYGVYKEEKKEVKQIETEKVNGEVRATKDDHKSCSGANGESSSNSSPNVATDPEIYEYPDPDFSDFDKGRREERFAVGQIWAVYDTRDAMPRFYARIKKVSSRGFELQITWLEPEPDDEDEIKWVGEDLPVSCGKFKLGNSEHTEDHPMFSHLVHWEKGSRRDTYKIYPRKGETWAIFKNWDIKWHSDIDCERKYEYEFVEVLSDYDENIGVSVAYLGKLRGFSCLFCRTIKEGMTSCQMHPNQLFRFSHGVPSFQMSGEEREDVPEGSFELDPACLPTNLKEIDAHDLKKTIQDPEAFEIPTPEFYNFESERSPGKFQKGQFWALYSNEDGLPKCYALIEKVNCQRKFRLQIEFLVASAPPNNAIHWVDKNMPISCGRFRLKQGVSKKYTETYPFSHELKVETMGEKDEYAIIPRKGEVWAVYKSWNVGITCSDLESCEYDIVQILEENDLEINVLVLDLVNGFKTVFNPKMRQGSPITMKFPLKELLRFSHQIPAFRLTEQRGGSLRGFWELDPAALPINLLCSN